MSNLIDYNLFSGKYARIYMSNQISGGYQCPV